MQLFLSAAAIYGLLGVVLGAFGAHALSTRLTQDMQAIWHTAVEYQFYHALALLGLGLMLRLIGTNVWWHAAGACFCIGIFIFSGSLYLLAASGVRWLGAITPIGGILLIAGWILLLLGLWRS